MNAMNSVVAKEAVAGHNQNNKPACPWPGVVMPHMPVIDKILALWCFLHFYGRKLTDFHVVYFGTSHHNGALDEYRGKYFFIDVESEKYAKVGCQSATERVCQRLGVLDLEPYKTLVAVANKNNRTGYLKGGELNAIAYLLREASELEYYEQELGVDYSVAELTQHALAVVEYTVKFKQLPLAEQARIQSEKLWDKEGDYLAICSMVRSLDMPAVAGMKKAEKMALVDGEIEPEFPLFSLSALVRDMIIAKCPAKQVQHAFDFWFDIGINLDQAKELTARDAAKITRTPVNLVVDGKTLKACAIHSCNPFMGAHLLKMEKYDLVVIKSKEGDQGTGNVAIITRKAALLNLKPLVEALNKAEAERRGWQVSKIWYHSLEFEAALNGSPRWFALRTLLLLAKIIQLVEEFVTKKTIPVGWYLLWYSSAADAQKPQWWRGAPHLEGSLSDVVETLERHLHWQRGTISSNHWIRQGIDRLDVDEKLIDNEEGFTVKRIN